MRTYACMHVSSFLHTCKQVLLLNSSCERGPYGFGESYNKMRGLVCLSLQVCAVSAAAGTQYKEITVRQGMLTLTCFGCGYLDIHIRVYNIVKPIFSYKADVDMLWLTLGLAAILLMWMPVVVCQVPVAASVHAYMHDLCMDSGRSWSCGC